MVDIDGDAKADLVSSAGLIASGNGDGTFAAPKLYAFRSGPFATGDIDGDGVVDLATASFRYPGTCAP